MPIEAALKDQKKGDRKKLWEQGDKKGLYAHMIDVCSQIQN